ncbi:TIGR04222 domain-containing membrane protein [Sphingomonas canadensis]|uniref:TIGR04222 domain-containing membrane protein n=1 Tax=Sphingomonas canadensis TaxID=1219257 RepID=A0ABW3H3Q3_9SPHN|nr:TIGR04222 domain-containing membrane protein [Sphingomonas canadensis]MCW3835689.1 TIGR04222 domain-containing membrane protein [Sphingomonas canadensis]
MTSPFDLTGPMFLLLYLALLAAAIVAGMLLPRWLRAEGREPAVTDPDQLAYLAGGRTRLAETVTSRLLASGAIAIDAGGRFQHGEHARGRTAAERAVLALPQDARWTRVSAAVARQADGVAQRLTDAGLLLDGGEALRARIVQTLPYLLVMAIGLVKLNVGLERERPVEALTVLLVITGVLALIRFAVLDRRTRGALAVLASARARSERLRLAPTAPETDMAVALFGTAVLAGSGWAAFHSLRTSSGSSDSGGSGCSSDSGCSGGDGGGGGCGGCGGGD